MIQKFEGDLPRVFIIKPGAEKEQGCDDLAQEMRGDSDTASTLICVWHDLSDRACPETGQPDDGDRDRINDGIATARWARGKAASPVTSVVLLFSPDFPTYRHNQQLEDASREGIYCMVHAANADEISEIIRSNMTDRARKTTGPAETPDLPGQDGSDEKEGPILLESFRKPPPATHASELKAYYRDPSPALGLG